MELITALVSECMGYAKTQRVCAARSDREEWVQLLVKAGMGVSNVSALVWCSTQNVVVIGGSIAACQ